MKQLQARTIVSPTLQSLSRDIKDLEYRVKAELAKQLVQELLSDLDWLEVSDSPQGYGLVYTARIFVEKR
jgi:hypothetical protein